MGDGKSHGIKSKIQKTGYIVNVVAGSGFAALLVHRKLFYKIFNWEYDDPIIAPVYGTSLAGIGLLSAVALTGEERQKRFLPLFYLQIIYKTLSLIYLYPRLKKGENWGVWFVFYLFIVYDILLTLACPWKKQK